MRKLLYELPQNTSHTDFQERSDLGFVDNNCGVDIGNNFQNISCSTNKIILQVLRDNVTWLVQLLSMRMSASTYLHGPSMSFSLIDAWLIIVRKHMLYVCCAIWEHLKNVELCAISLVEKIRLSLYPGSLLCGCFPTRLWQDQAPISMQSIVKGFAWLNLAFSCHFPYFLLWKCTKFCYNRV